ncbi:MAG: bifunctional oligoribonuclease/PAP phosphatase NrnA [Armatimonadetes bacterium]|nr:bifunctional oligoribonuclease/PAP phosphatase NrnA [Armatimonadota bacterium]
MAEKSPQEIREMLPALLEEIHQAESIIVGCHLNPDGDALGSALAFSLMLDQLGKPHEVLCHHAPPRNLQFLPHVDRIKQSTETQSPDLAVILDLEATHRLGSLEDVFLSAKRTIVIDHHQPHQEPGDLRIVSTYSPATAALLCDLFFDSEIEITPEMATCLLTGIITDTGSFKFPNTTSHSMHVSATLLEKGAKLAQVSEEVYMTKSRASVELLGYCLAHMKLDMDEQLAWTTVPNSVFQQTGATDEDTEGIVNEMLAIESVRVAAILREGKPGKIRGSLRSRGAIDVSQVARVFEGGGHKNASGVSFEGDICDAEEKLVAELRKCLA